MPHLTIVGAPALADRLQDVETALRVVVVGGPIDQRAEQAADAVREGANVFLLWPPAVSSREAEALARRAEEAGVEVGVARPLGGQALSGIPDGWAARLVTLTLVARTGGALAQAGWAGLLAGAVDLCLTLADARDASRLDAVAERDGDAIRAVALSGRFETGAHVQAVVRLSDYADGDTIALYASRPGSRVEARSLDGPLCVEVEGQRETSPLVVGREASEEEIRAFARSVDGGHRPLYGLDAALAALRLVERVRQQLR